MASSEHNTKKDKIKTNFMDTVVDLFDNKKRKNSKNNKSNVNQNKINIIDRIKNAFISLYTDESKSKSDLEDKKVTFDEKAEPGCQLLKKIFSTNDTKEEKNKVLYTHVNNPLELSLEMICRDRNPLKTTRKGDEEYVVVDIDGTLQYISVNDILDIDEKEELSTDSESFDSEVAGYFGIYSKYDEPIELEYHYDDGSSEQSLDDDDIHSNDSHEADLEEKGTYNIHVYENYKPFFEEYLEGRKSLNSESTYRRMYIRNKHYNVNSEKEYRFASEQF